MSPTTFFAASPMTRSGFIGIPASHPAHPSQFTFADDLSLRNYERELKDQPFPDGTRPILFVTGLNSQTRSTLIRTLILHRHGVKHPLALIAHSEDSIRRHLQLAADRQHPYVWIYNEHHQSHSLALFHGRHPEVRIYCSSPLPGKPKTTAALSRLTRIIALAG